MMFQRPPRGPKHSVPQYDPLAPNPFVPPNLPQPGQRGSAPVPKKMNTDTDQQYQTRLKRAGAKPPARPVPSFGGLKKLNTDSNAQFEDRIQRAQAGYPQPPKPTYTEGGGVTMRAPIPIIPDAHSANSPSDLSSPQGKPVAPSPFFRKHLAASLDAKPKLSGSFANVLPIQPNYIDRTNSHMQRPVLPNEMMPYEQTGRVPMSPGVNESFISGLPSRSERNRSSMQPSGMGDGSTFDAMAAREREARLAPQRALAQREDVTEEDNLGFTRTVDRDPNSPTFGQAKVVGGTMYGPSVPESVRSLIDDNDGDASILYTENGRDARKALNAAREPRRKARLAGEIYTDPATGAVSDYGTFNEAREARQERKDAARELRTRAAQLQNYGRTGGVMVDPSGGIAGPMHVGNQATFGPNMSRNQAIRMAQGEVDREDLLQEAMKRADDKDRMQGLKDLAVSGDRQAAAAYRREFGIGEDNPIRTEIDDAIASGAIPQAPKMTMSFDATPVKDREQMAFQIDRIIDSPALSRNAKIQMLEEMYGKLTAEKIDALQNGTSYDGVGPRDYTLTKKFKEFFGLSAQQQAQNNQGQSGGTNDPYSGVMAQQQQLMEQFSGEE